MGYYSDWGIECITFITDKDYKIGIVCINANKIDNAVIIRKTLTIVEDVIGMIHLKVLVAVIAKNVINNLSQSYQWHSGLWNNKMLWIAW